MTDQTVGGFRVVRRVLIGVKDAARRRLPFLHPLWMTIKRRVFRLRFRDDQARFEEVFRANHWRNAESASGFGSSLEATAAVRAAIVDIVERHAIESLLDIPCGDFNWMQHVKFDGSYCGADIVRELVARNQRLYGTDRRRFVVLDVVRDPLPPSDLVLCRDCLNHLSLPQAENALENILRSGSSFLAVTHYPTESSNRDQASGFDYRPINLLKPPFHWPPPSDIWEERDEPGKTLALWRLDVVRQHSNNRLTVSG